MASNQRSKGQEKRFYREKVADFSQRVGDAVKYLTYNILGDTE